MKDLARIQAAGVTLNFDCRGFGVDEVALGWVFSTFTFPLHLYFHKYLMLVSY
jgi:hypothetical protein